MTLRLDVVRRLCATGAVVVLGVALAFGQVPISCGHGPAGQDHHNPPGHSHDTGLADDGGSDDHAGPPLGDAAPPHCNSVLCVPALAVLRAAPVSFEPFGLIAFAIPIDKRDLRSIVLERDPPIPRPFA